MTLLSEYGLIHDIFDERCYSTQEMAAVQMQLLRTVLLEDALVRDFRNGGWGKVFSDRERPWHEHGRRLLRALVAQNRLSTVPCRGAKDPTSDVEWCQEALDSLKTSAFNGIITTGATASLFAVEQVAAIEDLQNAKWWQLRSPSLRLRRATGDYKRALGLVFKRANSIMFIDPHLDPTRPRYVEFLKLFEGWQKRSTKPTVEIHRICSEGSGRDCSILTKNEWQNRFETLLEGLARLGWKATVFIWDDFHDRYIISDLLGISVPNGFDISTGGRGNWTTWTRLGRPDRDSVQREFDAANDEHKLQGRFSNE